MAGIWDNLKQGAQGLNGILSEPSTTQMVGMQLLANSGPSVGAPRNMFEGIPQAVLAGNEMAAKRRDIVLEDKILRGKRSWLAQTRPDLAAQVENGLDFKTAYDHALEQMFAEPEKPEAPTLQTIYDPETGQPYKATWNPETNEFDRVGGTKAPTGPLVQNNIGGEPADGNLRKKLDEAEGGLWGEYKSVGNNSAAVAQDMALLDELIQIAPQGPIQGRLAEIFPGMDSAGAAFQSIVKRLAPTLRAPGSGSTSDIEYEGMLRSLPALSNKPEANVMIAQIMKEKAAINIERANIVTEYQTGTKSASEARQAMAELDQRSIMTPEMKQALMSLAPQQPLGNSSGGESYDELKEWLTPEEQALFGETF